MSHDHRSALRGVDENVGGGAPRGVNGKMTTPSSSSMRAEATTTTTPGGGDREVKEWKVRLYLSVCLRARLCARARVSYRRRLGTNDSRTVRLYVSFALRHVNSWKILILVNR